MSIITLLTDFGTRDWFVPSMKGVILGIAPRVQIVDMTHDIAPQDVRAGAFVLAAAAPLFPKGSIHVAVVDPGVGTERRAIVVKTKQRVYIGPDNGILTLVLQQEAIVAMRSLENSRLFRPAVSHTFHGRDIFSPVAAHLAKGASFASLGNRMESVQQLSLQPVRMTGNRIDGEVVFIDRFGNLISNIRGESVAPDSTVIIGPHRCGAIASSYAAVEEGELVAVINSLNLLEVGVRNGNAAATLGLCVGAKVSARGGKTER